MGRVLKSPLLITFSGIDGSGKSTQINALIALLAASGYRVQRLAFWDDVCLLRRVREETMFKAFKGERGIGAPGNPVRRRDKNIRRWYLTLGRCFLYLLDILHLRRVVTSRRKRDGHVIIFDRYAHDEVATLSFAHQLQRWYGQKLLRLAPRPDVAFLLDAEPEIAHLRKPEYPVSFLRRYRENYLRVAEEAGMQVVAPATAEVMQAAILQRVMALCASPTSCSAQRAA